MYISGNWDVFCPPFCQKLVQAATKYEGYVMKPHKSKHHISNLTHTRKVTLLQVAPPKHCNASSDVVYIRSPNLAIFQDERVTLHKRYEDSNYRKIDYLLNSLYKITMKKHQSSALLNHCRRITSHKRKVMRKLFPNHDLITS